MTAENRTNSLVFHIDQLLEEASELAKTERDTSKFYSTLLQRTTLAVDAQAAVIWTLGANSNPIAISSHRLNELANQFSKATSTIDKTIVDCVESNQPKTLNAKHKSNSLSVFCWPFNSRPETNHTETSADSAVTVYFTNQSSPDLTPVYQSFTEAIAEIATDFHRNNLQGDNNEDQSKWSLFKSLADSLHENLDVRSTAVSLVNLGREFYGCDRVLLAQRSGHSFKVIAASGAPTVNRKSETVNAVESLVAKAFYRNDKPVIFHGPEQPHPNLSQSFDRYQSASGNEFLFLAPVLDRQGATKFVQVIESVDQKDVGNILKKVSFAEPQTRSALNNATQHQSIPMRGILGALGGSTLGRGLRKLAAPLAVLGLLTLGILALWIVPTDLKIQSNGNLVPELQKTIYASEDGLIDELHVAHGDQVQTDQLLIQMTSNDLESEISRVSGQIETEKKRVEAIGAIKSSLDRSSTDGQRELGRLSSQEIESSQRIENLNIELAELERERTRLNLHSPISGTVATWDAKTKLENRPVRQGDALLRVVSNQGKWLAEVRVPDSKIAHLLNAAQHDHQKSSAISFNEIPVSLSIATFPEQEFEGSIHSISQLAEVDQQTGQSFIIVVVEIKNSDAVNFKSGSSVTAEFNCGETSCGYAWFNEFIDSIRYRFF